VKLKLHCTEIKKCLCTWWLQYRKIQVMFKVFPNSLQTFIDVRLTSTPSVHSNSNYVIMVSDWNFLKYLCVFLCCNHQVHWDFLIILCVCFAVLMVPSFHLHICVDYCRMTHLWTVVTVRRQRGGVDDSLTDESMIWYDMIWYIFNWNWVDTLWQ
jgi:hypothetical protein